MLYNRWLIHLSSHIVFNALHSMSLSSCAKITSCWLYHLDIVPCVWFNQNASRVLCWVLLDSLTPKCQRQNSLHSFFEFFSSHNFLSINSSFVCNFVGMNIENKKTHHHFIMCACAKMEKVLTHDRNEYLITETTMKMCTWICASQRFPRHMELHVIRFSFHIHLWNWKLLELFIWWYNNQLLYGLVTHFAFKNTSLFYHLNWEDDN